MKKITTRMWTKEDFARILELWDSTSVEDIARELGVSKNSVNTIVQKMKKAGIKIARKRRFGYISQLIEEFAKEYKK